MSASCQNPQSARAACIAPTATSCHTGVVTSRVTTFGDKQICATFSVVLQALTERQTGHEQAVADLQKESRLNQEASHAAQSRLQEENAALTERCNR